MKLVRGAIFRCYEEGNHRELAYLLIGDVSNDPDKPDVATLAQEGVRDFDKFLEREIRQMMARDGRRMIKKEAASGFEEVSKVTAEEQLRAYDAKLWLECVKSRL
jgi:hypothetical protein